MSKFAYSFYDHIRWQHLAAGVTGGVASTLLVHPLDLIKIRFQGLTCHFLILVTVICCSMLWKSLLALFRSL